ncbi:MAG: alpha/beta hydrolase [Pseudomonadota bacterium]
METLEVAGVGDGITITVNVQGDKHAPLILCVHGWPELSYSWRHQMSYFAQRGYRVAAMDVRGYGNSSKPDAVEAYTLKTIAGDVAAVARMLSQEPAVLFGHDWGALIVYNTALLYPDTFHAVAGMSVPFTPWSEVSLIELYSSVYDGRFFYIKYFQQANAPEREAEQDVGATLRKIYYALSGDSPREAWLVHKPETAGLLDGMVDPDPFPDWMSTSDLAVYVQAFERGGFRGPFNRYRAVALDHTDFTDFQGVKLAQPSCFIAGESDAIRDYVPGHDGFADAGAGCADFRGTTLIPKVGHWVQQEAPDETNLALETFLNGLS